MKDVLMITISLDGKTPYLSITMPVNEETKNLIEEHERMLSFKMEFMSDRKIEKNEEVASKG